MVYETLHLHNRVLEHRSSRGVTHPARHFQLWARLTFVPLADISEQLQMAEASGQAGREALAYVLGLR